MKKKILFCLMTLTLISCTKNVVSINDDAENNIIHESPIYEQKVINKNEELLLNVNDIYKFYLISADKDAIDGRIVRIRYENNSENNDMDLKIKELNINGLDGNNNYLKYDRNSNEYTLQYIYNSKLFNSIDYAKIVLCATLAGREWELKDIELGDYSKVSIKYIGEENGRKLYYDYLNQDLFIKSGSWYAIGGKKSVRGFDEDIEEYEIELDYTGEYYIIHDCYNELSNYINWYDVNYNKYKAINDTMSKNFESKFMSNKLVLEEIFDKIDENRTK